MGGVIAMADTQGTWPLIRSHAPDQMEGNGTITIHLHVCVSRMMAKLDERVLLVIGSIQVHTNIVFPC